MKIDKYRGESFPVCDRYTVFILGRLPSLSLSKPLIKYVLSDEEYLGTPANKNKDGKRAR